MKQTLFACAAVLAYFSSSVDALSLRDMLQEDQDMINFYLAQTQDDLAA